MTLRDIQILEDIIDFRLDLGLPLDKSVLKDFESKTKHLNYIFTSAVDLVYEFFKFDNKINNNVSKGLFKLIDENKDLNRFFSSYANRGLVL